MTRGVAREIAVHMIFSLSFGALSGQEVLDSQLTQERFQELAEELPLYAQYPNEKQEAYIRALVLGVVRDYGKAVAGRCNETSYGCLYSFVEN